MTKLSSLVPRLSAQALLEHEYVSHGEPGIFST